MEWFETICPLCLDDVVFDAEDCLLVDLGTDEASWRALFECPTCRGMASIRVPERVARALLARRTEASGFTTVTTAPGQRPACPDRPPLTWDDLLDFHELLDEPNWFDCLVIAIDQSSPGNRA